MTNYPPLARDWADQPRLCTCAMNGPSTCPMHRAPDNLDNWYLPGGDPS